MLKLILLLIAPVLGKAQANSLTIIANSSGVAPAFSQSESKLKESIFGGYDKLSRPEHQIELENGLSVVKLHLCHHKEILTVDAYMKYRWTDERLQWDKSEWNGKDQVHVPWTEVWVPDMGIYNAVGKFEFSAPDQVNRAIVKSNGEIIWIPQVHFQTSCPANKKDQLQKCQINVGPWTEDKNKILIKPWVKSSTQEPVSNVDDYSESKLIKITNSSIEAITKMYDCCGDELYNHIEMNIEFKHTDNEP